MFLDSLVYDSHVEEIHIPDIMTIGRLGNIGFTNLKKVTFMGHITKRFFNGDGQNGESCLFIGSYGRRYEMDK